MISFFNGRQTIGIEIGINSSFAQNQRSFCFEDFSDGSVYIFTLQFKSGRMY